VKNSSAIGTSNNGPAVSNASRNARFVWQTARVGSTAEEPTPRRRVGRPRANPNAGSDSPSEDILDAAAALFCSIGYSTTTTRQIADAAGLRQGSLFHYFARKEDILAQLLDRTVEPALRFVSWLDKVQTDPEVALATLVRADVANLCALPHNLGTLLLFPESRGERFEAYWARRAKLRKRYRAIVKAAAAGGRVEVDDLQLTTDLIFGLVESVITWYPSTTGRWPDVIGLAMAEMVLAALVPRRGDVARILARSDALLRAEAEDRASPGTPRPTR
jgi:AcrR family transcriptional regulator